MHQPRPYDLKPGELVELRVPFLFGSGEDIAFRKNLIASAEAKVADLVDFRSKTLIGGLSANEWDAPRKMAISLLACGEATMMFSTLGLGECGLALVADVAAYLRKGGKCLLLLNYPDGQGHEAMSLFPVDRIIAP